ncbi:hydroxyacid dehydrogenase [Catelliglobosispora koreensis]|uniref:hydroxyacid dehydrogenase n=1 Tax=Catelliglobosispora koreensis TaxID=129052 RepID=UPI00036E7932|nr:hydroxyacid dehydrogenase [Catelliglobosispora koreensis]
MVPPAPTSASRPSAAFALSVGRLFPDLFPEEVHKRINNVAEVAPVLLTEFDSEQAREVLAHTEILLTGWGCPRLSETVLLNAPRLKAVIHAAGTVKHHITPAVFERGILVSSAADANAQPVAEYTVAMLVLGLKRAFRYANEYAAGQPKHAHELGDPVGLTGTTVGVIGASRIGRIVIRMLQAYDVRVLVHDPYVSAAEITALGAEPCDLDILCASSHAVSVHAPELPETRHMVNEERLALMRDGTLLVNTARGSLVDTAALARHCATGRLDAVLDVTEPEPLPAGHPLLGLPNVIVTPHLAGSRGRELRLLGAFAAAELERYAAGLPLRGLVAQADLHRIA